MAAERRAAVIWKGDLANGDGRLELASGVASELPVSWASRTEASDGKTSPEELIAGAHASCYSMALSNVLAGQGNAPDELAVGATVTFDEVDDGFKVTKSELRVRAKVSDIDEDAFRAAAEEAKDACPVSGALKGNVEITLDAALE